jgi:indolepyruvate ferredoxin oxidoreductase alpha subunit
MKEILFSKKGEKIIALGNEAVCRGALEADVDFVSTYPGTPASEIGNTFFALKEEIKKIKPSFHFEFSTNEKVAIEAGAGASLCGLKSLVAMKNFGLNVASDFLHTIMYTGVEGAMVIFVADDPSCWSSAQSEQNTRFYFLSAKIPALEPSDVQEFKEFTKFAFLLSEKYKIPVMVRSTTRASHQGGILICDEINLKEKKGFFKKDPTRFSTMAPRVLQMKKQLLEKIKTIKKETENSNLNKIFRGKTKSLGIITSGISFSLVQEALSRLKLDLPILKLGFVYPLPEKKILKFLAQVKRVLIVEELEPYLEREITIISQKAKLKVEIFGKGEEIEGGRIWDSKRKAILPQIGELRPEYIEFAISKILNKKTSFDYLKHLREFEKVKITPRPPILCPGCPYWNVVNALKKVVNVNEVIFGGEIGCYMLFSHKAINLQDYLYCMGSSIGVAHGISKSTSQKVICFTGDSSFFHASIPALINTVFNESNPLIIILENQTTAMTGHQPHPGTKGIKILDIVKACGIKNVKEIDQTQNQKEFEETIKEFLEKNEPAVIIAKGECALLKKKKQ